MMKKNGDIVIESSELVRGEIDRTRLIYKLRKGENLFSLYFEVEKSYENYLCYEVADGVIIAILSYVMRGGYDVISKIPLSERLFYQISEQLIPQFFAATDDAYATKIVAPTICTDYHPTEVGMAMSCGVDSLASFYSNINESTLNSYKVSILTFFQQGAHHYGTIGHDEKEPEIFEAQLDHVKKYCERIEFPLLAVRSNLDEILSKLFWEDSYEKTHSFRNAAFVLVLQKLLRIYYCACAYNLTEFNASLRSGSSAHFESFLFSNTTTNSTTIYVAASEMSRIEKILYLKEYVKKYPELSDSLLVCYKSGYNCGGCTKCIRTLVELDVSSCLDEFGKSFDLEAYKRNRKRFIFLIYKKRRRDPLCSDICNYAKSHGVSIPLAIRIGAPVVECVALAIGHFNSEREQLGFLRGDKNNGFK